MAFISTEIKINEAARTVACQLYFPTDLPASVGNTVKGVITLLHGLSNTSSDWMMMSAACRYAADNGYIIVAPNVENSFYYNMAYGAPWYTIVTELLPAQLDRIFHIPRQREMNYIAGLSMGGYGAMRIGLLHPERYAAIGTFSGCVDMRSLVASVADNPASPHHALLAAVLGDLQQCPNDADLFWLAKKAAALPKEELPRILCTCGRQDHDAGIHAQNQTLRQAMAPLPLDFTYREWDGVHEWNFWDRSLAEFIGFIQNSNYGTRKQQDWSSKGGE